MQFVSDMLDRTAERYPDKTGFTDSEGTVTFGELRERSRRLASAVCRTGLRHRPVAVYLPKSIRCIEAMMAVVYSGNFYTVIDVAMPDARIGKIKEVMEPEAVITTRDLEEKAKELFGSQQNYVICEEAMEQEADEKTLLEARSSMRPEETMFILFTSGSTGVPKGVVISHRAETCHLEWIAAQYGLDDGHMVLASQVPMYFIMAAFDVFQTIRTAGECHLIPERLFSFPVMLLDFLKKHQINTLYIVPSVLCFIANFHALPEVHLDDLKLVIFGGEVMPVKQLNMWIREYPDTLFADLYGATEVADTLTYYDVPGILDENASIPIGKTAGHMKTLILDEENRPVPDGEIGELCGLGPSLADGYYHDPERTGEVFVPNPLFREGDPEELRMMYRMGDLVKKDENGDMIYIGRKDFQIKHMGHRIELGEIETAASSLKGIDRNCCIHDKEHDQIVLFYTGTLEDEEIILKLRDMIPDYMVPTQVRKLAEMPLNLNGKIDRALLKRSL